MLYDIILALLAVCGIHYIAKVLWLTFTAKIDRRAGKEYNGRDVK